MATMDVKDAADQTVIIEKPLTPGRAAAAASRPVVLSTEDSAALAAILAKLIASPATAAHQVTEQALLQGIIDAVEAIPGGGGGGDASAANQVTGNAILTAIAGYVDGLEAKDYATQTTLAAVLAKIIAAPATEAKQDTLIAKDFATQTTLAALLAKVIAAPATEAKQDTIIGHVDGIETLITALNALITTQNGYLDGVETLVGTTNTTLTTIDGRVDTLEAAIGATNETAASADTGTFGLNALIKRQLAKMTSALVGQLGARTVAQSPAINIATDDPQIGTKVTAITALATGGAGLIGWLSQIWNELATNGIKLISQAYDVAQSFTRPANTTAYTAGDVVGATAAAITFASMGPNAGAIMITGAQLEVDISAVQSGMANFRLHLYSVTPPSALADNAVWDLPSGDRASYLGFIDIGTPVDLGSTCYVETSELRKQVKLAGTSLFGYLQTIGAYTPASADVYKITLHAVAV